MRILTDDHGPDEWNEQFNSETPEDVAILEGLDAAADEVKEARIPPTLNDLAKARVVYPHSSWNTCST